MIVKNFFSIVPFTVAQTEEYIKYKQITENNFEPLIDDFYSDRINLDEAFIKARKMFPNICEYTIDLMFVIECTGNMFNVYLEKKIPLWIYENSIRDIYTKIIECESVFNVFGIFCGSWHEGFLKTYRFALGRLQFNDAINKDREIEIYGNIIKQGDFVALCHIPSGGKLTQDDCLKSYTNAYQFFKNKLKDGVLPIKCDSWLLYPPYRKVFGDDTNIGRFINNYKILSIQEQSVFPDCWRVFNRIYQGSTQNFPRETGLQKRFIEYIDNNGTFGQATGILLFDGKKIITE